MPCFLQTLTGNLVVLELILAPKQHVCVQSDQRETSFFGVKFLMCSSKIALQLFVFFGHPSRRLGPFLLSWVLRSTPHFMDFWWDRFHWFDWLHCAYWLVAVRSCDVMLGFLDVEIGGKKRRKVPGIAFKYSSKVWIFWTNCRSDKTDKQIHLLSYSLSWASPSLTRHDVPLKDQVPCPSWNFVQRLTVALLNGSFKNDICSPCLGVEH